ncbi:MAG: hypothetical protein K6U74_03790 [Firmicutes bacterium]|nr:hypothetical protein [Bacillota bacterium]
MSMWKPFWILLLTVMLVGLASTAPALAVSDWNPDPADGASGVSVIPTLSWGGPPGATFNVYLDGVCVATVSDHSWTVPKERALQPGTTHVWKVAVRSNGKKWEETPAWSFTTAAAHQPNIPSDPFPADGATGVGMAPTLKWKGSDFGPDDPVKYQIFFETAGGWRKVHVTEDTSWQILPKKAWELGLAPNTTHRWYVVAKDSTGLKTQGPVWSFTTGTYPWIIGGRFSMTPFSSGNPDYASLTSRYRYGPSAIVNITGENFGTATGRVKFVSKETNAVIWISQDSRYGKILSWSENSVQVELPGPQAFGVGRGFPFDSVYKLKVEPAGGGVRSNPVWLYIRPGGGNLK